MHRGAMLAFVALVALVIVGARAAADAIPAPPDCAPHQELRRRGSSHHSGVECVSRRCQSDRQCGGTAHCATRRVCRVTEHVWVTRGRCHDVDGDGDCDNRERESRTYERGPCDPRGGCAEGRCVTLRDCQL